MTRVSIDRVENGYLLNYYDGETDTKYVFEQRFDSDESKDYIADLLNTVVDLLGESGSRYDEQRVRVSLEPGDKYEGPNSQDLNGAEDEQQQPGNSHLDPVRGPSYPTYGQ